MVLIAGVAVKTLHVGDLCPACHAGHPKPLTSNMSMSNSASNPWQQTGDTELPDMETGPKDLLARIPTAV